MSDNEQPSSRSAVFRQAITEFIDNRRDTKLSGLSAEKASEMAAKYDYDTWIESAVAKSGRIKIATHIPKATHGDAKGSSFYCPPRTLPSRPGVGTKDLGERFDEDVVADAAALDAYTFLDLKVYKKKAIRLVS